MKQKYLRDISLQTGIEHARGLIEAQRGKVPSFVSKNFLDATIEDATITGRVARYVATHPMLKGTVFVAEGQECFLVRCPNRNGYAWFANRFYVVSFDAQRGYRCSAGGDTLNAATIEQVKLFLAQERRSTENIQ